MTGRDTAAQDDIEEEARFWRNYKGKSRYCGLVAVEMITVLCMVLLSLAWVLMK